MKMGGFSKEELFEPLFTSLFPAGSLLEESLEP